MQTPSYQNSCTNTLEIYNLDPGCATAISYLLTHRIRPYCIGSIGNRETDDQTEVINLLEFLNELYLNLETFDDINPILDHISSHLILYPECAKYIYFGTGSEKTERQFDYFFIRIHLEKKIEVNGISVHWTYCPGDELGKKFWEKYNGAYICVSLLRNMFLQNYCSYKMNFTQVREDNRVVKENHIVVHCYLSGQSKFWNEMGYHCTPYPQYFPIWVGYIKETLGIYWNLYGSNQNQICNEYLETGFCTCGFMCKNIHINCSSLQKIINYHISSRCCYKNCVGNYSFGDRIIQNQKVIVGFPDSEKVIIDYFNLSSTFATLYEIPNLISFDNFCPYDLFGICFSGFDCKKYHICPNAVELVYWLKQCIEMPGDIVDVSEGTINVITVDELERSLK